MADPAIRSRLSELGQDVFPADMQSPETLGAYHEAEYKKWFPIIKAANIKLQ